MTLAQAKAIIHILIALVLAIIFGFLFLYWEYLDTALRGHQNDIALDKLLWFGELFKWLITGFVILVASILLWAVFDVLILTSALQKVSSVVRRQRVRIVTKRGYGKLGKEWANFVTQGLQPLLWRVRSAIANEYLHQEGDDLSGEGDLTHRGWNKLRREAAILRRREPEGRPLIITSFIRYSKLVRSVVEAVQQSSEGRDATILCLTTLNMPIRKWLNFDEKLDCAYPGWERYLDFVRGEIISSPNDVVFSRILIVRDDNIDTSVNIRKRSELKSELKNWVWLTKRPAPEGYVPSKLLPLDPRDDATIITALREGFNGNQLILDRTNRLTANDRKAYFVVDSAAFDQEPRPMPLGEFARLGPQFITNFQSACGVDRHAYYAVVDPHDYEPNWDQGNNLPPHPLDIFFVALVPRSGGDKVEALSDLRTRMVPLFCLGAEPPERGLYVSYLYLLDPQTNPRVNFQEIMRYVDTLMVGCRPLSELCNEL